MSDSKDSSKKTIYVLSVEQDMRPESLDGHRKPLANAINALAGLGQHYNVKTPSFFLPPAQERKEFRETVAKSDGILLVFGSGTKSWFYSKELELRRWRTTERLLRNEDNHEPKPIKRYVLLLPSNARMFSEEKENERREKIEFLRLLNIPYNETQDHQVVNEVIDGYGIEGENPSVWSAKMESYLQFVEGSKQSAFESSSIVRVGREEEGDFERAPFPGLRSFELHAFDDEMDGEEKGKVGDEPLFFGRDDHIDEMVSIMARERFLAVLGVSGSGKSSLVNCGFLPALHGGYMTSAGPYWKIARFSPQSDPIGNLNSALERVGVYGTTERGIVESFTEVRGSNRPGYELSKEYNLLIYVDQFEELFTHYDATDSDQKNTIETFLSLLLEYREYSRGIYVVITMRSDFLGEAAQYPSLPYLLNKSTFLVPNMSKEELEHAVRGPLSVADVHIDPPLLEAIKKDFGDDLAKLPILQHALNRTWWKWYDDRNRPAVLTRTYYDRIGGMALAMNDHADELYNPLAQNEKTACEIVFRAITEKSPDGRAVRRLIPYETIRLIVEQLPEGNRNVADRVYKAFSEEGVTFLYRDPNTENVEISHESLITNWQSLKGWVDEEAVSVAVYNDLLANQKKYGQHELPDVKLREAKAWQQKLSANRLLAITRHKQDYDRVMKLIEYSEEEKRNREKAKRRAARFKRWALIIGVPILILALWLVSISLMQRAELRKAWRRQNALVVSSHAMPKLSANQVPQEIRLGKILSLMAFNLTLDSEGPIQNDVHEAIRTAFNLDVSRYEREGVYIGPPVRDPINLFLREQPQQDSLNYKVAFSEFDQEWMAGFAAIPPEHSNRIIGSVTASPINLWRHSSIDGERSYVSDTLMYPGSLSQVVFEHGDDSTSVLFAAGSNGVRLWRFSSNWSAVACTGLDTNGPISAMDIAQGNEGWVMAMVRQGQPEVFDVSSNCSFSSRSALRFPEAVTVSALKLHAYSAGENDVQQYLAVGTDQGTLYVWDTLQGQAATVIQAHDQEDVLDLEFVMDGPFQYLLSAGDDYAVHVWGNPGNEVSFDNLLYSFFGPKSKVNTVDAHVDINATEDTLRVIAGNDDGQVVMWTLTEETIINNDIKRPIIFEDPSLFEERVTGRADVRSVVFSPDGSRILAGVDDHSTRLHYFYWRSNPQHMKGSICNDHIELGDVSDISAQKAIWERYVDVKKLPFKESYFCTSETQ